MDRITRRAALLGTLAAPGLARAQGGWPDRPVRFLVPYSAGGVADTIARILHGDPWEADATSPLLSPGANLQVGDAITAINGQRVTQERSPQQLLVNQAGAEVLLTVQPAVNTDELTELGNRAVRRNPEEIDTYAEQDHVTKSRNQYPFP